MRKSLTFQALEALQIRDTSAKTGIPSGGRACRWQYPLPSILITIASDFKHGPQRTCVEQHMNEHGHRREREVPSSSGDDGTPRVVLYSRRGCHLCDDARRLLEAHGVAPKCVDVDLDPQLRARFGDCVPVVEIDGRIRFRGRVERVLLRRLLRRRLERVRCCCSGDAVSRLRFS